MQPGSHDSEGDGEYNGARLVKIYETVVAQDDFFQWNGTIWLRDHVGFIPNNADKLRWNVIRGGCLFRHEMSNAGLISLM